MKETTKRTDRKATIAQTADESKRKTLADIIREYETAYTTNAADLADKLYTLATAAAYSGVNKTIDPQRKAAAERDGVSDSGMNPALVALRRGIAADLADLAALHDCADRESVLVWTEDGETRRETADPAARDVVARLVNECLTDGIDLVQEAVTAILEESAKADTSAAGWMEKPYKTRRVARRVLTIMDTERTDWKEAETTPIQEVYRAVRRAIADSRAVQTDPRNGYSYIEELTADPETGALDTLYIRLGKYADLGGYAKDANGAQTFYTADRQTALDYASMLAALNLTARQTTIVKMRMGGKGTKAIAAALGVTPQNIKTQLKRIQDKCTALGYTPAALVG